MPYSYLEIIDRRKTVVVVHLRSLLRAVQTNYSANILKYQEKWKYFSNHIYIFPSKMPMLLWKSLFIVLFISKITCSRKAKKIDLESVSFTLTAVSQSSGTLQ